MCRKLSKNKNKQREMEQWSDTIAMETIAFLVTIKSDNTLETKIEFVYLLLSLIHIFVIYYLTLKTLVNEWFLQKQEQ